MAIATNSSYGPRLSSFAAIVSFMHEDTHLQKLAKIPCTNANVLTAVKAAW